MVKNIDKWIGSYLGQRCVRLFKKKSSRPIHIMFCFADHFEPDWNAADQLKQAKRIQKWVEEYPKFAQKYKDVDGCHPKHTFFYPAETYDQEHLAQLETLFDQDLGEVEIHLHHDNDTEGGLRAKLERAKLDFSSHGFLGRDKESGEVRYGFIHGNWALNNSRSDGRWCGVNDEIRILKETGCYADFTFPSAPSETQPNKINSLYYAKSDAQKPKGHNRGKDICVGGIEEGELMLVQGPLCLNWRNRKWGILPRIENSDVSARHLPTEQRVDLWVKEGISVKRRPDWIFIKIHTHGAPEENAEILLSDHMERMHSYLQQKYNDGTQYKLHYVTAREMYNIAKAAEAGENGSPHLFRSYSVVKG